jgi:hypothetical protein
MITELTGRRVFLIREYGLIHFQHTFVDDAVN